ncbi:WecB/TagA/CpsF family glycosyltransferase [Luedemannella helvata]|uniref:WecB/TagA/CpsF family glycosyltransferase n=1 Tax=Luedemannella helvata TaxID=349315 RepID=UPI0031E0CC70
MNFDPITEADAVHRVRAAMRAGLGGRIVTPNVDILRLAARDDALRAYLNAADLVVADGMPVVWASRLSHGRDGCLPERVAGADLIWSLSEACAIDGRRVFLIGGVPPAPVPRPADPAEAEGVGSADAVGRTEGADAVGRTDGADAAAWTGDADALRDWSAARELPAGAARAAAVLGTRYQGLRLVGAVSPPFGFLDDPAQTERLRAAVVAARPHLVFVGLGFAKQERVIELLAPHLPDAWFLGCGAAIDFVDGDQRRAPGWMRRSGLEWAHRLAREPGRLAGRYLRHDVPYALGMLARAAARR